ncbi:MAG: outer membrane lipoprotein carrier protein [Oleiphilaceae bacterium]|jgi:outer membrane lipoprotein carrier protein
MKKIMNIVMLALFSLCLVSIANAATQAKNDTALTKLVETLSKINTFSGKFVQYAVDQKGARIQESRGELKADRSGLFYWHTTEPLEQTVVSNGVEVTVYDPDLEQATIQAVGQQAQTTPAILFSGDMASIGESFHVEIKTQVGQSVQYALKPINTESLFERLVVRFEGDNFQELRITDALGQESTMSFIQTQINLTFPDNTFEIILPEGTDIIRDVPTR